eukprot:TRINITY_DN20830_c0_g1_i1.p1 TRINITY_DN20830_c0_g1~~TRINITY_DN20830_c0_g1_i1.p1  ORF type:complete len:790 (-),score=145.35 TRINITY_DN20830_c0_g1_i1:1386-3677(-)
MACGIKRGIHPPWYPPNDAGTTSDFMVNNSLTESKEPFFPGTPGRKVTWYTCGPTVYDSCHMGHARAYLTFDILRRIVEDYFHYDVIYQINITDIDDKIILRARHNYLIEQYIKANHPFDKVFADATKAVAATVAKLEKKVTDLSSQTLTGAAEEERKEQLKQTQWKLGLAKETEGKLGALKDGKSNAAVIDTARQPLADMLDADQGDKVTDKEIFGAHARKYEREYYEDMEKLGVKDADVITRVTEYVPQIVDYIQKIIDRGFAYALQGSVYFDTGAFKKSHDYRKLKPSNAQTSEAEMAEGEGALGGSESRQERKSPNDFALWKASKRGEPSWDSPWGAGRPGWHIECSVVASDILGENIDFHAGGVDLKFPHHDNELAQSEAYHDNQQWINYFIHAGHLHIEGLKMSKSLKNFITIKQALEHHSARQIRIMFLLQQWDKPMNYSDQAVDEAKAKEDSFKNLFGAVKAILREDWAGRAVGWTKDERDLWNAVEACQRKTHLALSDNFNTPLVMAELSELCSAMNVYMKKRGRDCAVQLLRKGANYITKILTVFGVVDSNDAIGWSVGEEGGANFENRVAPVLNAWSQFRDDVRNTARAKQPPQATLEICDNIRDEVLPGLGIQLEDQPDGRPTLWKLDDPKVLLKKAEEKKKAKREQEVKTITKKLGQAKDALQKWQDHTQDPEEKFKDKPEKMSKKAEKLREKEIDKYTKVYKDLQGKGDQAAFFGQLKQEIADWEGKLAAATAAMGAPSSPKSGEPEAF